MSATCYSDEYDDVMINVSWCSTTVQVSLHQVHLLTKPTVCSLHKIFYTRCQRLYLIFYHVLIEPGILSKAVTLAALPSRLQPPFPLRMPISPALRTSCTCPHEHSPMPCSSHFFQTCTQETVLFLKPFSCPLRLLFAKMCCSTIALKHYLPL